ncbi:putative secretion ATP-binding protein [Paramagnetospirillum magnetotacticum MS-1]|uniref:Putative secretion ATP-binding protein n=1 Tax=Paramagnetospirillum magnetotacticum MS-1 TaxID=272627 RepID=A0A0C2Z057_PARME|nr:peptidase domain-containing ABC transporter [Paramagnetospirillum magnetotacticum]KIM00739.1 putative secretion ATP-binding protein [Paramagnetospirillum magnetotacticum MS-1]
MTEGLAQPMTVVECFSLLARHHGIEVTTESLVHEYVLDGTSVSHAQLVSMANANGLKAKVSSLSWGDLAKLGQAFPVLGLLKNGNGVIFSGMREENGVLELAVIDPLADRPGFIFLTRDKLAEAWDGHVLLLKRRHSLSDPDQPFGLAWFVPEILKQSRTFGHVALAAIFLHLIGLTTPFFFQIVIDKVLVHHSLSTLYVLTVGVLVAIGFEAALGFLRNYMLLWATNKIDARLAARTFDHLMRLPMHFFEQSSAGVLVKHMQQTESIREFMTGKLFMTALDSTALLLFIPILLFYSVPMALIVLTLSGLVAAIIFLVMPIFRRNLEMLYQAEGSRQAMLVETIHGMRTVKALAIEPDRRKQWNDRTAQAITRHFAVGRISVGTNAVVAGLDKLSSVAVVFFGALFVFDGKLSVGEVVAIQMMAGRVSGPLVQLVQVVNQFQQTSLSIRMLGEVMNRKTERSGGTASLHPQLTGDIRFEDVTYHYPGAATPALAHVEVEIRKGSMVGVVGRSGSGKTTFTRLLQGLYLPQAGMIRFDGFDIRELDLAHLRRSIGVVVQESFLFRGSVRENIAVSKPGAPFEHIVEAARLAGADEFIKRLPQGYDTMLEENGANLSGGQKQRLSIARALLPQPRIMIFDEATSALDPESEAIVQENLDRIAEGRTMVIVSHRLSSLTRSDVILVFDQGRVVDAGSHAELLTRCEMYQTLWRQQTRFMAEPAS